jgi:hypothetical protein
MKGGNKTGIHKTVYIKGRRGTLRAARAGIRPTGAGRLAKAGGSGYSAAAPSCLGGITRESCKDRPIHFGRYPAGRVSIRKCGRCRRQPLRQ